MLYQTTLLNVRFILKIRNITFIVVLLYDIEHFKQLKNLLSQPLIDIITSYHRIYIAIFVDFFSLIEKKNVNKYSEKGDTEIKKKVFFKKTKNVIIL